jgi:hypothetical protein
LRSRRDWGGELALERQPHITDIPQSPPRILSQAKLDRAADRRRDTRGQCLHVHVALDHARVRACRVFRAKGAPAREHLVEHAAEGPDVGPLVNRPASHLFRAHVGGRPHDDADLCQHRHRQRFCARRGGHRVECFGEAEVEHLRNTVRPEQDVRGLEIAVHDAALMRRLQRIDDLSGDGQRLLDRNRADHNAVSECQPFDQLHRKRRAAIAAVDAVDLRDVLVIERGQHFGLSLKSCQTASVANKGRGEHLQSDIAFQVEISGAVDLAHAARADEADDFVRPEASTAGNRHVLLEADRMAAP